MNKSSISNITALLKKIKPIHYLVVLAIIGIGIFNAVTGIMPQVKQSRYERGIEKSFNKWWEDEGANQFKIVGVEPTEKIRQEEFEQFRNRAFDLKPSYIIEDGYRITDRYLEYLKTGRENRFSDPRFPELTQWIDNLTIFDSFERMQSCPNLFDIAHKLRERVNAQGYRDVNTDFLWNQLREYNRF